MRMIHIPCPLCGAGLDLPSLPGSQTCICPNCCGEFALGEDEPLILDCPSCAMEMSVDKGLIGERIDCPHCAHEFVPQQIQSVPQSVL